MKEVTSRNNNLHPFSDLDVKKIKWQKISLQKLHAWNII